MEEDEQRVERSNEGSAGPIIGTIIILVVIVLGGLYFWGQRGDDVDGTVESINVQSESDEIVDIEADLEDTDLDNLDLEVDEE